MSLVGAGPPLLVVPAEQRVRTLGRGGREGSRSRVGGAVQGVGRGGRMGVVGEGVHGIVPSSERNIKAFISHAKDLPPVRIELTTPGLQDQCSATEL